MADERCACGRCDQYELYFHELPVEQSHQLCVRGQQRRRDSDQLLVGDLSFATHDAIPAGGGSGARPLGYWRLNEKPDDGSGNNGAICTDYQSGNNGIYTNVYLDQASAYSPTTDPAETSVQFGTFNLGSSDANSIGGNTNIDFSSRSL